MDEVDADAGRGKQESNADSYRGSYTGSHIESQKIPIENPTRFLTRRRRGQRSDRRKQPEERRYRQPDVVNSVAIWALDRI